MAFVLESTTRILFLVWFGNRDPMLPKFLHLHKRVPLRHTHSIPLFQPPQYRLAIGQLHPCTPTYLNNNLRNNDIRFVTSRQRLFQLFYRRSVPSNACQSKQAHRFALCDCALEILHTDRIGNGQDSPAIWLDQYCGSAHGWDGTTLHQEQTCACTRSCRSWKAFAVFSCF